MKLKVLLILLIMSIWILPIDLFAMTPVDGNYVQLNGVTLNYSGSASATWTQQRSEGFLFFNNGWGYLDYQGTGTLGNGLMPSGVYTFSSTNPRYSILQIGQVELNIYEYSYTVYFDKDFGQAGTITFEFSTLDPLYQDLIIVQYISSNEDYMYFRIYDNAFDEFNRVEVYNDGFTNGYSRGLNDYAIEVDGELIGASEWGVIQYNLGLAQGPENTLAIRNMIPGILGVTFAFFFQLASISFLGISALDLIGAVITIATSIFIIRIFLNR